MMIVNKQIEFAPVYFNSVAKTVINHRFRLESSFQEILYMIDVWINDGSGWNVELRSPKKGGINIEKRDQKCFLCCDIRDINLSKKHLETIKRMIKRLLKMLTMMEFVFPVQEKDLNKVVVKNNKCINVFGYENRLIFPIYVSDQTFQDSIDLLLLIDDENHAKIEFAPVYFN